MQRLGSQHRKPSPKDNISPGSTITFRKFVLLLALVFMVDSDTVRRIALSLPESRDGSTATALRFYVRDKQFAWTYHERIHPKRPRQPRLEVLAVRCAADDKERLLASDPGKFFTTDHYRGFPAVLVYLDCIDEQEIRSLLAAAWRCQAPAALRQNRG
jgi:hypothetical protein